MANALIPLMGQGLDLPGVYRAVNQNKLAQLQARGAEEELANRPIQRQRETAQYESQQRTAHLDRTKKEAELWRDAFAGVKDDAGWQAGIQHLLRQGLPDAGKLPPTYNPALHSRIMATASEKLMTVAPGASVLDPNTKQTVFTAPAKPENPPAGHTFIDPNNPAAGLKRIPGYDPGGAWVIQDVQQEDGSVQRVIAPRPSVPPVGAAVAPAAPAPTVPAPAGQTPGPTTPPGAQVIGSKLNPNTFKPLPTAVLEDMYQAQQAFRALDQMEKGLPKTGVVRGWRSEAEARLGVDKEMVDFRTAKDNFKLAAQSLIKGIPSDFDVKTVMATMPDMTAAEETNRSRLEFSRQSFKDLVEGTVAYWKSLGYQTPPFLAHMANRLGLAADNIKPWSGTGDALQKALDREEARDAIAKGAPRDAVIKRLRERGGDPAGL